MVQACEEEVHKCISMEVWRYERLSITRVRRDRGGPKKNWLGD